MPKHQTSEISLKIWFHSDIQWC